MRGGDHSNIYIFFPSIVVELAVNLLLYIPGGAEIDVVSGASAT